MNQERVIVEHLLKMRDQPAFIDTVAMKAPAELVVDPTVLDLLERPHRSIQGRRITAPAGAAQQQLHGKGRGEFGLTEEPTPALVVAPHRPADDVVDAAHADLYARRDRLEVLCDRVGEALSLMAQRTRLLIPAACEGLEQGLKPARHAAHAVWGKVGSGEKRQPVRVRPNGHRPAAAAVQLVHSRHVHAV